MIADTLPPTSPESQRIVITGIGLTAPNGNNLQDYRNALLSGSSGIQDYEIRYVGKTLAGICDFEASLYQPRKDIRRGTRAGSIGIYAGHEAVADAGLDWENVDKSRVGIYLGVTEHGNVETENEIYELKGYDYDTSFWSHHHNPRTVANNPAGEVALNMNVIGPHYTIGAACAAGNAGLIQGAQMLRLGEGIGRSGHPVSVPVAVAVLRYNGVVGALEPEIRIADTGGTVVFDRQATVVETVVGEASAPPERNVFVGVDLLLGTGAVPEADFVEITRVNAIVETFSHDHDTGAEGWVLNADQGNHREAVDIEDQALVGVVPDTGEMGPRVLRNRHRAQHLVFVSFRRRGRRESKGCMEADERLACVFETEFKGYEASFCRRVPGNRTGPIGSGINPRLNRERSVGSQGESIRKRQFDTGRIEVGEVQGAPLQQRAAGGEQRIVRLKLGTVLDAVVVRVRQVRAGPENLLSEV